MSIGNVTSYQAVWNDSNRHLAPAERTTTEKVLQIVYLIFSILIPIIGLVRLANYGLRQLALYYIQRSAYFSKEEIESSKTTHRQLLQHPYFENSTVEEHSIKTPDGVNLKATFYRNENVEEKGSTLIYFNPNGAIRDDIFVQFPTCHLVTFDYRGVADSEGELHCANDLIIDGSSIVQWVQNGLGVSSDKIHFYGRSLGGAIAANAQALDPALTGVHINDRSFSSLDKVIEAHAGDGLISSFVTWFLNKEELNLGAVDALRKIQGEKLLFYHPDDEVIPLSASLHEAVLEAPSFRLERRLRKGESPHNFSLFSETDVTERINLLMHDSESFASHSY